MQVLKCPLWQQVAVHTGKWSFHFSGAIFSLLTLQQVNSIFPMLELFPKWGACFIIIALYSIILIHCMLSMATLWYHISRLRRHGLYSKTLQVVQTALLLLYPWRRITLSWMIQLCWAMRRRASLWSLSLWPVNIYLPNKQHLDTTTRPFSKAHLLSLKHNYLTGHNLYHISKP